MQLLSKFLLSASVLVLLTLQGYCQPQPLFSRPLFLRDKLLGETINKPVHLRVQDASVDDYLIALGDAADVNILADATEFPTEPAHISGDSQRSLGAFLLDFTHEHRFTWKAVDQRTCLLWTDPDIMAVAQHILDGEKVPLPDTYTSDRITERLLTAYLQRTHGWDGKSTTFSKDIKLAELSPELRDLITAKIQVSNLEPGSLELKKAFLTDEFWQQARLRIIPYGVTDWFMTSFRNKSGGALTSLFKVPPP